ncbi:PREDICTED: uncharacterized protein LOC109175519 [Ipomoea nil]|uniref:uncharacterized protein LOC109175519 n=1 Tax=Ipomoea nil TaxID=35883 RepID=UPI000901A286|nr:PREDICTED: uncharacterized protein LOC109175519 [Ipomoea nil]
MAVLVREDGVSLSTTDAAPSHFMFKIQSVSSLAKHQIQKYTSAQFEAGGYKWKLIFYPNGNNRKGVTDHISMHLAMAETSCFQPGWEVHAVFRLFLLHQNNDTYLVIRDAQEKGRRFRETRTEWGFDRIVPTKMFHNGSYGFVVDDVCVFGAEVYVHKEIKFPEGETRFPRGECLSMFKDPHLVKYSWTIPKIFGTLSKPDDYHESPTFQQWKMRIYPNGKESKDENGTHLSLSLHMVLGDKPMNPTSRIYAKFTLHLVDRHHRKNWIVEGSRWFEPSSPKSSFYEWPKVISKEYFKTHTAGFWSESKDECTIEAEVRVHGVTAPLLS